MNKNLWFSESVNRRKSEQVTVFLYGYNSNIIAMNTYSNSMWSGWSIIGDELKVINLNFGDAVYSSNSLQTFTADLSQYNPSSVQTVLMQSVYVSNSYAHHLFIEEWSYSNNTLTIKLFGEQDSYRNITLSVFYK